MQQSRLRHYVRGIGPLGPNYPYLRENNEVVKTSLKGNLPAGR
jgi:hypothetical protein